MTNHKNGHFKLQARGKVFGDNDKLCLFIREYGGTSVSLYNVLVFHLDRDLLKFKIGTTFYDQTHLVYGFQKLGRPKKMCS